MTFFYGGFVINDTKAKQIVGKSKCSSNNSKELAQNK